MEEGGRLLGALNCSADVIGHTKPNWLRQDCAGHADARGRACRPFCEHRSSQPLLLSGACTHKRCIRRESEHVSGLSCWRCRLAGQIRQDQNWRDHPVGPHSEEAGGHTPVRGVRPPRHDHHPLLRKGAVRVEGGRGDGGEHPAARRQDRCGDQRRPHLAPHHERPSHPGGRVVRLLPRLRPRGDERPPDQKALPHQIWLPHGQPQDREGADRGVLAARQWGVLP
mmetsp:Transcript_43367/g.77625  ORF Transcript_43367/g.77625 Transcript_43367/m.77625 type:complete len:225 (-) Transcript_43367:901-1575(-)